MIGAFRRQYMSPMRISNDLQEQVFTSTASSPVFRASHTTAWREKNEDKCTTCSSSSSESPSLNPRSLASPAGHGFVEEHNGTKPCSPAKCQTRPSYSAETKSLEKYSPTKVTREPQDQLSIIWAGLDEEVHPKRSRKRTNGIKRMRLDRKAAPYVLLFEYSSQQEDICLQLGICSHVSHSDNPLASIDETPREQSLQKN